MKDTDGKHWSEAAPATEAKSRTYTCSHRYLPIGNVNIFLSQSLWFHLYVHVLIFTSDVRTVFSTCFNYDTPSPWKEAGAECVWVLDFVAQSVLIWSSRWGGHFLIIKDKIKVNVVVFTIRKRQRRHVQFKDPYLPVFRHNAVSLLPIHCACACVTRAGVHCAQLGAAWGVNVPSLRAVWAPRRIQEEGIGKITTKWRRNLSWPGVPVSHECKASLGHFEEATDLQQFRSTICVF